MNREQIELRDKLKEWYDRGYRNLADIFEDIKAGKMRFPAKPEGDELHAWRVAHKILKRVPAKEWKTL